MAGTGFTHRKAGQGGSVISVLLVVAALLSSATLTQAQGASAQAVPVLAKVQPILQELAVAQPDATVAVIVQKSGWDNGIERLIARLGGTITKDLRIINAFAAPVPARAVPELGQAPGVRWVSLDAPTISSNVASNGAVAVWYSSSGSATKYVSWDGITFTGASNTASLGTITQGLQDAAAPTRNEKVVIGIDAFGALKGEVWNGSAWTLIPGTSLGSPGFCHQWAYDAVYEQQSGDALIAFADGMSSLKYATWNGSAWSSAAVVSNYASLTSNTPKRVALAAKPGSDEIALVVTDNLGATFGFIWNGSSWGNGATLNSGTGGSNTVSAVVYEHQSGRAVATYGKFFGDTKVYYRVWDGSTWSAESSTAAPSTSYVSGDYPGFTTLASDPNSNRIVLGVTTANTWAPKTWMNLWDGTSWGASVTGTVTAVGYTFPGIAVAFESQTGDALAAFGNASLNYVYYKTWTSAVGWLPVQAQGPNVNAVPNVMILESDPNSDQIMLAAQNATGHRQRDAISPDGRRHERRRRRPGQRADAGQRHGRAGRYDLHVGLPGRRQRQRRPGHLQRERHRRDDDLAVGDQQQRDRQPTPRPGVHHLGDGVGHGRRHQLHRCGRYGGRRDWSDRHLRLRRQGQGQLQRLRVGDHARLCYRQGGARPVLLRRADLHQDRQVPALPGRLPRGRVQAHRRHLQQCDRRRQCRAGLLRHHRHAGLDLGRFRQQLADRH
jgi:hypothetical protein